MWNVVAMKKMKMSQRKRPQQKKKVTWKLSGVFRKTESAKHKILEADPDLERSFPKP